MAAALAEARFDRELVIARLGAADAGTEIPGVLLAARAPEALTVSARVVRVKRVGAGAGVSYGHRYRTSAAATLALLGVGYADGLDRDAGGRVQVLLAGRLLPIVGRVAMNVAVVDAGDAEVQLGDEAVLFAAAARSGAGSGPGLADDPVAADVVPGALAGASAPSIRQWAAALGRSEAELAASLTASLPRSWS